MSLPVLLTSCGSNCEGEGKGPATLRLSWSYFDARMIRRAFAYLYSDGHLESVPLPPTSQLISSCDPVAFVLRNSPSTLRYDPRLPGFTPDPESEPYALGWEATNDAALYRLATRNIAVELYTQHGNTAGPREFVGGDLTYAVAGTYAGPYVGHAGEPCLGTSNLYPSPLNIDITDDNRNYCLDGAPVVIRVTYYVPDGDSPFLYTAPAGSSGNYFGIHVLDSSGHRIAATVRYLGRGLSDDGTLLYYILAISKFEDETPDPFTITYYEQLDYFGEPVARTIPSVNFMGPNILP